MVQGLDTHYQDTKTQPRRESPPQKGGVVFKIPCSLSLPTLALVPFFFAVGLEI